MLTLNVLLSASKQHTAWNFSLFLHALLLNIEQISLGLCIAKQKEVEDILSSIKNYYFF